MTSVSADAAVSAAVVVYYPMHLAKNRLDVM